MTRTDAFEQVEVRSVTELRQWLAAHHAHSQSVWLVTFKKHVGTAYVSRSAVLDELLCFGWVDGLARKLDADRTMQLISPRRTDAWTQTYRERAARLERDGRMQSAGRAAIARSQLAGLWEARPDVDALLVPSDLESALKVRPGAYPCFMAFAPSHRRNVLRWIAAAKKPATRERRIETAASLAAEGKKVPQF
ncbi:MAG: YdeI/OmpD-associated family protein [Roseateles sp.]|nr:hypothetical protein [Methylibium sp.]MBY0365733.1 YdeI/OmpD-associated family protein [Burkholderiaceae bacterium]